MNKVLTANEAQAIADDNHDNCNVESVMYHIRTAAHLGEDTVVVPAIIATRATRETLKGLGYVVASTTYGMVHIFWGRV